MPISFKHIYLCALLSVLGGKFVIAQEIPDKHGEVSANASSTVTLVEGDILVSKTAGSSTSHATRGLGLSGKFSYWLNGVVSYELDPSLTEAGRDVVVQAVEYWNKNTSVTLVERSVSTAGDTPDYIKFVDGPGCASWVGRQGQSQEIWVSEFCTAGSMIHEIGHAFGLLHEHTRADRDQFVTVLWDNIQGDKIFNFDKSGAGTGDLDAYDYDSIMHYGEYFFSQNGNPTLAPINAPAGAVVGQRERLSAGDLAAIDTLYGTDLALGAQSASSESGTELTLFVTNNGSNGAQKISVRVMNSADVASFSSTDAWSCESDSSETDSSETDSSETDSGVETICTLDVLLSGSLSTLILYSSASAEVDDFAPVLSSKTFDPEKLNNGYIEPGVGAAEGPILGQDASRSGTTLSGGGGSLDILILSLLMLGLFLKASVSVIGSKFTATANINNAHTDFSTSSGRTSCRL